MTIIHRSRLAPVGAGLAVIAASGALAACGVNNEKDGRSGTYVAPAVTTPTESPAVRLKRQQAAQLAKNRAALGKPISGVVRVDGQSPLGISTAVQKGFAGTTSTVVRRNPTSDAVAFRDLCDGKADVVESSRSMTAAELARCSTNGVNLLTDTSGRVRPLQLASEGIVIATKNASDVGGDCLRRQTVRSIFASGSKITNWSQVGFDNLPLTTTGRAAGTNVFNLFGNLVLGANGDANAGDLRSDYKVQPSDAQERDLITGNRKLQAVIDAAVKERNLRIKKSVKARRIAARKASAAADKAFLKVIKAENAARAKKKIVLTPAQAKKIDENNRRRDAAAKANAARAAAQAIIDKIVADIQKRVNVQLAGIRQSGVVGYFRFTYYELFEDLLRPIEIWDPAVAQASFESRGIATNRTRIQPQTATAARVQGNRPNEVAETERLTYKSTPTTPGAKYIASGGTTVVVPSNGPVNVDKAPSCVFPSRTTITNGVYPLSTRLLAYVSRDSLKRQEVQDYLGYYLYQGQNVVANERLIPLGQRIRADEYKIVTGKTLPFDNTTNTSPAVDSGASNAPVTTGEGTLTTPTDTTTTTGSTTGTTTSTTPSTTSTDSDPIIPAGPAPSPTPSSIPGVDSSSAGG